MLVCPQEARERLQLVERNAARLHKLVNSLLDFSRIEAGRVQASYEETDLAALTRDLASTFRSAMEKAGLTFVVDCDELGRARIRRSGDVGKDRAQSSLERVQVHVGRNGHGSIEPKR